MTVAAELPVEGALPDLGGATRWLNSEPLTPAGLRGKVVVVQFCTFSCVNWLRTLPYVCAWAERYRDDGLVVIGAHSPEFPFEHEVERVRPALADMGVEYPIAMDNDFAVWRAFHWLTAEERRELLALLRRALESAPAQSLWSSEEGD